MDTKQNQPQSNQEKTMASCSADEKKAIKYRLRNIDNPVDSGKTMKVNDTFVLDANGNPYTNSLINNKNIRKRNFQIGTIPTRTG